MTKAQEILNSIKEGNLFHYDALIVNRTYTISINSRGNYVLSANDLKRKEVLNEKTVLNIITNDLVESKIY